MAETKISVIGTGNMGRTLGISFARAGYHILFSGRDPSGNAKRAADLAQSQGHQASAGTLTEAAEYGDILVWTTRERDVVKVLGKDGVDKLKEKGDGCVILDLNNYDFANGTMSGNGSALNKKSLGEELMESLSKQSIDNVAVIKAFTTIPMEPIAYDEQQIKKEGIQIFVAGGGNNKTSSAKTMCAKVIGSLGFEVIDLGDDPIAMRMAEMMGDVMRYCLSRGAGNGVWSHLKIVEVQPISLDAIGERTPGYT